MKPDEINIEDVKVSAYNIPTDAPESDGTIEWNSATLVLVAITAADKTGIGYSYADASSAFFIEKNLKKHCIRQKSLRHSLDP